MARERGGTDYASDVMSEMEKALVARVSLVCQGAMKIVWATKIRCFWKPEDEQV